MPPERPEVTEPDRFDIPGKKTIKRLEKETKSDLFLKNKDYLNSDSRKKQKMFFYVCEAAVRFLLGIVKTFEEKSHWEMTCCI